MMELGLFSLFFMVLLLFILLFFERLWTFYLLNNTFCKYKFNRSLIIQKSLSYIDDLIMFNGNQSFSGGGQGDGNGESTVFG